MCTTPWCYGDCEDCLRETKRNKEYEERTSPCPHNVKCKLKTVSVKQDQCTTCGKTFNY